MGNDGKIPAKDKGHFPRPLGGPEPSPLGDTKPFGDGGLGLKQGYDFSKSIPGTAKSDLNRGYCNTESITDATKSDGMEEA